ncbi:MULTISPECIES: LytR/AlgR family response regulator transcription factor [Cellulophaga]|uniref:Two component transcriptional regulator, LytTR family n=2 Tax=Cellulophaga TaxID=104264 RepID=F0RI55_CELLC|nr:MULTISPECIES: LytTR family DNA-binding domain-containing protein [Cellulophaga]ADY30336.1 two component transcriptional regulator, LytTR family [Cellulophaga lytica DSM 7489]AIM61325.1 LytR family transcriptional regulator [Cellulophaga lytica]APU11227.1 DNA-binding response regulator [Cellulophaga lytica]EWH14338.1 LytTR family two component transcriptional regulator [Cellulophaga geojensis KL-A]MDO6854587.1 LytTR family DNA-binding domain-containing protein [Cellulophaga lytica]
MNVIIIEDEKPAARRLSRLLAELNVTVSTMLHSVEESIIWFNENDHPDLIFLDIQLSDGLSFEIFDQVNVKSAIIFTTAYDEYALQAFKLNSIDYLLKPIDDEELEVAVNKYKNMTASKTKIAVDFEDIKKLLVNPIEREYKKRFTVKVGQHIKIINADEIECFFSENKGTYAATADGRNYLLDVTLENLESELEPKNFFRVSRKFYVNVNYIKDIVSYTNSRLKIVLNKYNDSEIIVSREKVKDFKLWLE